MFEWEDWYYLLIFLPLILGIGSGFLLGKKLKDAGSKIPSRPPRWVFGLVWPFLYLFIGCAWAISLADPIDEMYIFDKDEVRLFVNIFYSLLLFLLIIWTPIYSRGYKKIALYVITMIFGSVLMTYSVSNMLSRLLLCPLLAWMLYAVMLNFRVVNKGF